MARIAALAALDGALGVALGTLAVHGFADPQARSWAATGSTYLLVHAAAAIAVLAFLPGRMGRLAAGLMAAGALVFGTTLGAMAAGAPRWLGAVTPGGGTLMLLGWTLLMAALIARTWTPR